MTKLDQCLTVYKMESKDALFINPKLIAYTTEEIQFAQELLNMRPDDETEKKLQASYVTNIVGTYTITPETSSLHWNALSQINVLTDKELLFDVVLKTASELQKMIDENKAMIYTSEDSDEEIDQKVRKIIDAENLSLKQFYDIQDPDKVSQLMQLPFEKAARGILFQDNLDMLRLMLAEKFNDRIILEDLNP